MQKMGHWAINGDKTKTCTDQVLAARTGVPLALLRGGWEIGTLLSNGKDEYELIAWAELSDGLSPPRHDFHFTGKDKDGIRFRKFLRPNKTDPGYKVETQTANSFFDTIKNTVDEKIAAGGSAEIHEAMQQVGALLGQDEKMARGGLAKLFRCLYQPGLETNALTPLMAVADFAHEMSQHECPDEKCRIADLGSIVLEELNAAVTQIHARTYAKWGEK